MHAISLHFLKHKKVRPIAGCMQEVVKHLWLNHFFTALFCYLPET